MFLVYDSHYRVTQLSSVELPNSVEVGNHDVIPSNAIYNSSNHSITTPDEIIFLSCKSNEVKDAVDYDIYLEEV